MAAPNSRGPKSRRGPYSSHSAARSCC